MATIALLDPEGRLVGLDYKPDPEPNDLVVDDGIDLPLDGTYKWDGHTFVPLGHGFGPISYRPPISETRALYLIIQTLGDTAPTDLLRWAVWYEAVLKKRDEETAVARQKAKK